MNPQLQVIKVIGGYQFQFTLHGLRLRSQRYYTTHMNAQGAGQRLIDKIESGIEDKKS